MDTRTDVYSFGATYYHLLVGAPPFTADTPFNVLFKHKMEPLISPRHRNPAISERTSEILERCMAKSPEDRFPSFVELRDTLDPGASSTAPWEAHADAALARHLGRFEAERAGWLAPDAPAGELARFELGGRLLSVFHADLRDQAVEAFVSSDDEQLTMSGGVARALREGAGEGMVREAGRYPPVRPGRAVVTSAGDLPARFIFHGVTLTVGEGERVRPSRDLLAEILTSCFYHADALNVRSIALPLLGTGTGGFSREVCLDTLFRFLLRHLHHGVTAVEEARLVIFP